jgi:hypothetical protein
VIPVKLYVYAIALLLALGGFFGYGHARYAAGHKDGANAIQVAWDADKEAIQRMADAAIAQATKDKEAAQEANGVIRDEYETQLFTAHANAQSLAQRLSDAEKRATAGSGSLPKTGSGPSAPAAGPSPSNEILTGLLANVFDECSANASQLDALIAEIKPQL